MAGGYSTEEIRKEKLNDFRVFLRQVWDHLRLPPPTPIQNDIAHWLQHGPDRGIMCAFRGVGKSWITVAFVLWVLFLNPQMRILVVSASEQEAIQFSIFAKRLVDEMPLLAHLRGGVRDSYLAWDVGPATADKAPSVRSVGITGQLQGPRADLIVADDVETEKNSYSHKQRERIASLVREFDSILKPGGKIVYLGTPQVENSLYVRLVQERQYTMAVWPAEVPEKPDNYTGRLAPYIRKQIARDVPAHTPLEPSRFNEEELQKRRISYGPSGYALQYMLDTSLSSAEKYKLRCHDLIVMDVDNERSYVRVAWGRGDQLALNDLECPGLDGDCFYRPAWTSDEMAPWQGTVMAIDPSGTGTDETAVAIVRQLFGKLYVVRIMGFKEGFSEATLKAIASAAARYRVTDIIVEKNYGGGTFTALLTPYIAKACGLANDAERKRGGERYAGCKIHEDVWHSQQKELRILDTLEPVVQAHRLVMDRKVIEEDLEVLKTTPEYSLMKQFTRMERIKGALPHEDRLEALSMAVEFWVTQLELDEDKAHAAHKEQAEADELQRWGSHMVQFSFDGPVAETNYGILRNRR